MKKLAVFIIVAFAFSMAAAVAQTGTDPSQGNPGASPSTSQPGASSQQQPGQIPSDPAARPAGQATSTDTGSTDKEKTLRGCVQSQGGQYVLEGKKGKTVALTGQDVSAHVGHEVSVKGTWESSAAAGTSPASSGSAEKTFNVASVDMISDTCSAKSGKGTSPGSSNPAGETGNPPQNSNPPQK